MAKWLDVGSLEDFPAGTLTPRQAGPRNILMVASDQRLHAVLDVCPHAGKPLHEGSVCGQKITCRYHGYAYDLGTGRNVDFPYDEPPLRTLPVHIVDGRVRVDVAALERKDLP